MANLTLTNASATQELRIDVDNGDRENRYAKWVIAKSDILTIDEADINPYLPTPHGSSLPSALYEGKATIVESGLDSLDSLAVKNFVAKGLGLHYYTLGADINANLIVIADATTGYAMLPTAGDGAEQIVGVTRQDGTTGQYVRVKTEATANDATVTVKAAETIAAGDKVCGDTNGEAVVVPTTADLWYLGVCTVGGGTGENITVSINIKQN